VTVPLEACAPTVELDWGDGTRSPHACASGEVAAEHAYSAGGRYRVAVVGNTGADGQVMAVVAAGTGKRVLSVSVAGTGRVTGNGIDCPGVCNVELAANTPVALTARGQLEGWGDACSGTGACAFVLEQDRNVAADFGDTPLPDQHTLTVAVTGAGRVTGGGIDCPGTCSVTADEGTVVTLTAAPAEGQRFTGWGGACSGSCTLTLDGDQAVSAAFEPEPVVQPDQTATPTPMPSATPSATPTPTPTPTPSPTAAVDVVAAPAGGTVLVKLPRTNRFVALKAGQELPYGTEIDTRKGRVTLTAVPKPGAPAETAVFYDGLFKLSYVGGITNLTLSEPLAACPKAKGKRASAAQKKKAKARKLWGDGKGSFRTSGRHSAATVRGTKWLVQDTCAGTLTRVTQGAVTVRHGKKVVVVRAGKRYLAKAR
jgi:hypothetical protein